ncbi:hypothetical protein [Macrococcus armenti]|uniref:Signal transduction protein TRAP n=1 Tax=Macrococcus armenti TaxID=2875764 RepID=A0ABY3ZT23_9STAP|nr:hypothetical protein [Macrococcus armenti]UOB20046.1 hypothetical protein MRZ06_08445 [Macrococcus armenti]
MMKTYITYGTEFFLKQIVKNHKHRNILTFAGEDNTYLYEETNDDTLFSAPQSFEVLMQDNTLLELPTLMIYFVVSESRQDVFDTNVLPLQSLKQYEGYHAFRLLKPLRGETYVYTLQFHTKAHLNDFKKSSFYRNYLSEEALKQYQAQDFINNIYYTKHLAPLER